MQVMSGSRYKTYDIPGGKLRRHPVYRDMVECDVLINVPIAKQHGSTGLTLAGKNLMGCTSDRGRMHNLGLSRTHRRAERQAQARASRCSTRSASWCATARPAAASATSAARTS